MVINFYIDDTGTKEKTDSKTDIFGYCGIAIPEDKEAEVIEAVDQLKLGFFGNTKVELKSKWFRLPEHKSKNYLIPFGKSEDEFNDFSRSLFDLLNTKSIRGLGSVISKSGLQAKYTKTVFDASPVSYELLLQRIANLLTQFKADCTRIVFDDMTGKNKTGREWKRLLINQHRNLLLGNSPLYRTWKTRSKMNYDRIPREIVFVDSTQNNLIQVADLFAYNIMRQGRDYKEFDGPKFYEGYSWIKSKMHSDPKSKKITGFGALFYP